MSVFFHSLALYFVFMFLVLGKGFAIHKIAIEGMPGAGKSTTLIELINEFQDRCIFLSETNPEPNAPWKDYSSNAQGEIFHQLWVTRMSLVDRLPSNISCVLFDRTYFSNLAFKFALDSFTGTDLYSDYMELFNKDLKDKTFSLIIVLKVSPEIGLSRRNCIGDKILYPWTEISFLNALSDFYDKELENLTECPIITICTDTLTPGELKEKIRNEIQKLVGPAKKGTTKDFPPESKNQILKFAHEQNLGEYHSDMINVLGYPTIYFRQHSVLNHNNKISFLNNKQLKVLTDEYNS